MFAQKAGAERAERHASQERQRERGQQSVRRDDGEERFGRALRELLLKDVRDRVGDDADDDREDGERSDLLLHQRLSSHQSVRLTTSHLTISANERQRVSHANGARRRSGARESV